MRFTPDLAGGALEDSSSSSSSASLSELEEDEDEEEEEEEDDEEEEGDDAREDFFGASPISTSESLDSSELLSLSLEELEEEELAAFFASDPFVSRSHFWNSSSREGAFFESASELAIDFADFSLANSLLVLSKSCSDKNDAIEAINCAGREVALLFLLVLVC